MDEACMMYVHAIKKHANRLNACEPFFGMSGNP